MSVVTSFFRTAALRQERVYQWEQLKDSFAELSILTGIPLLDEKSGNPNYRAWLLVTLSVAVPTYLLYIGAQALKSASEAFGSLL